MSELTDGRDSERSLGRIPPSAVREALRKEVHFGCPVEDCGVPYLKWHHFDPPWDLKNHHDPKGMIALCSQHADFADDGRWTKEQLIEMKENPFVTTDSITSSYSYLRRNTVCRIGNLAYNVRDILDLDGERVIGFTRDPSGYNRLNLLIRDSNGQEIFRMENSDWIANTDRLHDIVCSARGKTIAIIAKDRRTRIVMRFDDFDPDDFKTRLIKIGWQYSIVDEFLAHFRNLEAIPVWTISGKLRWKKRNITIQDTTIIDQFDDGRVRSIGTSTVMNRPSALQLGENVVTFG